VLLLRFEFSTQRTIIVDDDDVDFYGHPGYWGPVFEMKVMAIHAMLITDGLVLIHGADGGVQGGDPPVFEIWNVTSGEHQDITNHNLTTYESPNVFCSTANIDISTGNVVIFGGDTGNNDGIVDATELDIRTLTMRADPRGVMKYPRWYPSSISLPDGRIFVVGGSGIGQGCDPQSIPEIWSPTEGFRSLPKANIWTIRIPLVTAHWNSGWWYPHTYVNSRGEIIVVDQGLWGELEELPGAEWLEPLFNFIVKYLPILDSALIYEVGVEGKGKLKKIGVKPFSAHKQGPSIMYRTDQVAFLDNNGYIWSVDLSRKMPKSRKMIHTGFPRRTHSVFALLPDGKVSLVGGCVTTGEGNDIPGAVYNIQIWDPVTNTIFTGPDQTIHRLYHSSSIILPDGTVFSGGGGAPGPTNEINGNVYFPGYLLNNDGRPATRPMIEDCPKDAQADTTIFIQVDNAADIRNVTTLKAGHMTHARNFDARWLELHFTVKENNILEVPLPDRFIMIPGLWSVHVINSKGVPSVASLMTVNMGYFCGSCGAS
jgi:Domain of unknown function (DUF1929)